MYRQSCAVLCTEFLCSAHTMPLVTCGLVWLRHEIWTFSDTSDPVLDFYLDYFLKRAG